MLACGVCATDLHLLHGMVLPPGASYPVRPGHEIAGIVEQVNGDGARVAEGDLAVLHPLAPCGQCPACKRGEDQHCQSLRALGMHDPGGFAEFVVWPSSRMLPANGMEPAEAALLADAAATAHNAVKLAEVPRGGSLCVLGAGGLGMATLAVARALDPDVRLAAVVRSDSSSQRLQALGVEVHRGLVGAARGLRQRMGRVDAVIDFSGSRAPPLRASDCCGAGAACARVGRDAELTLGPSSAFMGRELQVVGAYVSKLEDLETVIALAQDGRLDASGWVSHRLALDDFEQALELAEMRPPGTVRVVVETGA